MSDCLNDDTVAALLEQRLGASAIRQLTEHIDRCGECRALVAEAVRSVEQPSGGRFGRYEILECIGAGAMGIVYLARDPDLGRKVALKLLRPDPSAATSQDAPARLLREAQSMARLSHPNVITVYEVGAFGDEVFLAMEFVEGTTLGEWMQAPGRSWRDVLAVFRRAGEGLEAAHAAGLVHRDFKPDNVLVGVDGRVRVTDFGLARAADGPAPPTGGADDGSTPPLDASMTRTGTLVGTPAYMAPEQLAGRPADARSDVFSFCVALYEGLYGERPFAGVTPQELARAIELGDVRKPPSAARVPSWLGRVVLRGLEGLPESRPSDMRALLGALASGAARARRRRAAAALAAMACVSIAAMTSSRLSLRPSVAPAPAARPTSMDALPIPSSTSAEALRTYRRALQRMRDGDWAESDLRRATELDPALAAAHLRFAVTEFWEYPTQAREHLAAAADESASLSDRDRLLLRAAQAWMQTQPADSAAYARLLDVAIDRYPLDAELTFYAAAAHDETGDRAGAVRLYDRAVALDPAFGSAYRAKAEDLAYGGDFDGALAVLDACIGSAPGASSCIAERAWIEERDGDCDRVEQDARRLMAHDPTADTPYWILALAAYAEGQPIEAVREILDQRAARVAPALRPRYELWHQWALDVLSGDFDAARGRAAELERSAALDADRRLHARAAFWSATALLESGRDADAARAARDFLRRKEAWLAEARADDFALLRDPTPMLLVAERRGGLLSPADFDAQRSAWATGWQQNVSLVTRPLVWLYGYAAVAESRADADLAMAEQPAFGSVPAFTPRALGDAYVGTTYFLAGRRDEALPYLRRAARSCMALESPVEHTRVHLVLGQALESLGRRGEACAAYAVVLQRWGRARPRSVTAEQARARAGALGCPDARDAGAP